MARRQRQPDERIAAVEHVEQQEPQESDEGLHAAGRHLRLAWRALARPLATYLRPYLPPLAPPPVSLATRAYLLFNVALYGVVGLAFLSHLRGLNVAHTGLIVVDNPTFHVLWGVGAFAVCLSQVAALLSDRWLIWQACAVSTAVLASALTVVTLFEAHNANSYGGVAIWLWIVGVHFLFISNQLTPHTHGPAGQVTHTAAEERELLAEVERVTSAPSLPTPTAVPPPPHS